jgi:FkbM family methyltransferase
MLSPAYVYRPSQVARRLRSSSQGRALVALPWGDQIRVSRSEQIGAGLARAGVHELAITETLWRLAEPGDAALDIGANIGYFTALLGHRCARVRAFEPHPVLRDALEVNVDSWPHEVTVDPRAVSDHPGAANLSIPPAFGFTEGVATLEASPDALESYAIETTTLDDVVDAPIGIAKIDVEGHEPAVIAGGEHTLTSGLIRDIVFEEHDASNSVVFERLAGYGYTIFGMAEAFRGVELVPPLSPRALPRWEAPNYLATLQPERALRLMSARGWRSLRARPRPISSD